MPLTVIVRAVKDARMTFDATQRVVIGRGAGSDVRLPDASVSLRHATLRAQGADFIVFDEGSTNGTFVGSVRVAPRTSRIVRSGNLVRVGRIWLELRIDQSPVTRDVAGVTRDLALALVSQALRDRGATLCLRVHVVEGRDQGTAIALAEDGASYVVGRAPDCALPLADVDVSRQHVRLLLRASHVLARDLGTRNGTWIGEAPVPADDDVVWKPAYMMKIGRTVLALEEPLGDALASVEAAADEPFVPSESHAPPPVAMAEGLAPSALATSGLTAPEARQAAPVVALREAEDSARRQRSKWSGADVVVMATALAVLGLSLAGLVWLLRN